MEFVKVSFPGQRQVYVDGIPTGFTNDVIQVQTGTHSFDLGAPRNYEPSSRTARVTGTVVLRPMIIAFQPIAQQDVVHENEPAENLADREQVDRNEPAASDGFWSSADGDLKQAFTWAASLAAAQRRPQGSEVDTRALFGGLIKQSTDGRGFAEILASVASRLPRAEGLTGWKRIHRKLALPSRLRSAPTLASPPKRTTEVDRALQKALAFLAAPDDPLTCAWVFLALFRPDARGHSASVDPLLAELGVDAEAFLDRLREGLESQEHRGAAIVDEIMELRRTYPIWGRPHVDNDRVDGAITQDQDLLDARKPALRFAKLLAAEKVTPPIALGLFGNWGSGKTFFMGLMRDRIQDLAKNGGPDYVRRVVQIDFNAWHYHDTNLWASLAMHIFEGLAEELAEKKESEVEAKRKELHQKIRSSEARRNEAEERRKQALDRRGLAAKQLESKQAQREEKQKKSIGLRLEAAWGAVSTGKSFEKLRSVAKGLSEHFGIPAALESADDLGRLRRDVAATREQALELFTAVGHRFRDLGAGARTTGWLVLAAGTALAFGWGIEDLATRLKLKLPDFSATVIQVATMVSTAAAWCGRRVKEAQGALDTIAKVEADLAKAEKEVVADGKLVQLQRDRGARQGDPPGGRGAERGRARDRRSHGGDRPHQPRRPGLRLPPGAAHGAELHRTARVDLDDPARPRQASRSA